MKRQYNAPLSAVYSLLPQCPLLEGSPGTESTGTTGGTAGSEEDTKVPGSGGDQTEEVTPEAKFNSFWDD